MAKKGRPTDYRPKFCEMLINHMSKGYSFESFAGLDEVATTFQTLYAWVAKNEDFLEAKLKGKAKSLMKWEKDGIEGIFDIEETDKITGITTKKKLNAAVYRLQMRNRFGWQDGSSGPSKTDEKVEKPKLIIQRAEKNE